MNIKFEKVIIHNFLSFGHSEVDLQDRGYCVVKGVNECENDMALSNGSGKSSIWSSITFALTGETIQGITSNLKNIYIDEDSCYVTLNFNYDGVEYEITRYKAPKSDLKIIVNGEDKSGKGIRDSEAILESYLPDLTRDLLASVIILGQGMPNKFSSFTPSGRKELLEKLSKSDFMVDDIKVRVSNRISTLKEDANNNNNEITKCQVQLESEEKNLKQFEGFKIKSINDYEDEIHKCNVLIDKNDDRIKECKKYIDGCKTKEEALTLEYRNLQNKEINEYDELEQKHKEYSKPLNESKSLLLSKKDYTRKEIERIKNIKDVCPTCGQKIPNVIKPDTSGLEKDLEDIEKELGDVGVELQSCDEGYMDAKSKIRTKYVELKQDTENELDKIKSEIYDQDQLVRQYEKEISEYKNTKSGLMQEEDMAKSLQSSIKQSEENIKKLNEDLEKLDAKGSDIQKHLDVVTKMETLIKRDFRGFLLTNVIDFINTKAKDYCKYVLGYDDFTFALNGNNIDISYNGKEFENLSGGEQQKIDLILQLTIRDMLKTHLNFSTNILVLDEITDFLDRQSCDNIITMISNKCNDVESVFIISHHPEELQIPMDSEILVVKNNEGISEVR